MLTQKEHYSLLDKPVAVVSRDYKPIIAGIYGRTNCDDEFHVANEYIQGGMYFDFEDVKFVDDFLIILKTENPDHIHGLRVNAKIPYGPEEDYYELEED